MLREILKFKITLVAEMWDKPPIAHVTIDNKKTYFNDYVTGDKQNPTVIEFEHAFQRKRQHHLSIYRLNNSDDQTIIGPDDKIQKQQMLTIKSIEINNIEIKDAIWHSEFTPIFKDENEKAEKEAMLNLNGPMEGVADLGLNGKWNLCFTCPFASWVIDAFNETLNRQPANK